MEIGLCNFPPLFGSLKTLERHWSVSKRNGRRSTSIEITQLEVSPSWSQLVHSNGSLQVGGGLRHENESINRIHQLNKWMGQTGTRKKTRPERLDVKWFRLLDYLGAVFCITGLQPKRSNPIKRFKHPVEALVIPRQGVLLPFRCNPQLDSNRNV